MVFSLVQVNYIIMGGKKNKFGKISLSHLRKGREEIQVKKRREELKWCSAVAADK